MNPETPFGGGQNQPYGPPQPPVAGSVQYGAPQASPQPQPPFGSPSGAAPASPVAPAPFPTPTVSVSPPKAYGRVSKAWLVIAIVFIVLSLALAAAFVWAYLNYTDNRDNVDSKVSAAVNEAEKKQKDYYEAEFIKREKEPNRVFAGPEDYGSLAFTYPKIWSMYVAKDAAKGGTYEAYFSPVEVVSTAQQFALRVFIEDKDYDKALDGYKSAVSKGTLKSTAVKINGVDGTRFDGMFTKDINGAAVVFKIRDKTVTIQTDAQTFVDPDFNALINTITFNK